MSRDEKLLLIIAWVITIALTIITIILCQQGKPFIKFAIVPWVANVVLIVITAIKIQNGKCLSGDNNE